MTITTTHTSPVDAAAVPNPLTDHDLDVSALLSTLDDTTEACDAEADELSDAGSTLGSLPVPLSAVPTPIGRADAWADQVCELLNRLQLHLKAGDEILDQLLSLGFSNKTILRTVENAFLPAPGDPGGN